MVTADFNGDGKMDIAVVSGSPGFTVLLGRGDGSFTRAVTPWAGPGNIIGFVAADFNSDGTPDLLAIAYIPDQPYPLGFRYILFLGNGDGSFRSTSTLDLGGEIVSAVADFNGDGKPDLLLGTYPLDGFTVRFGNGDGTFQADGPATRYPDGDCCFIVTGDFNHDGRADVAMISVRHPIAYIATGNGDGTFKQFNHYDTPPAQNGLKTLAVGDLNRDGNLDLVVGAGMGVCVLLGKGDGTFQPGAAYEFSQPRLGSLTGARSIVADLNGDGILDVANGFTVLTGNGDGSLQAPLIFGQWMDISSNTALALADFNGDGKPDLLGVAPDGMGLSLLINNTGNPDASIAAVSGADYRDTVAPGAIATLFGKGLSSGTESAKTLPLPTVLQNTKVHVLDQNGVERLAGLIYVSPSQINFLMPPESTEGYAIINVDNGGTPLIEGARATVVRNLAGGFFTLDGTGHGVVAATAVAIQANGAQTAVPVFQCSSTGQCVLVPIDMSTNGTVYLSVYGTGFAKSNTPPGFNAACSQGTITYAGPQGQFPGLDQLNLQLPRTLPSGLVNITCGFGLSWAAFTVSIK